MCVCVCVCARACVRVCVCLGGEGSESIWNKCEKGKGKEGERRLSASVMNSHLCKGRHGHCVAWPMQGSLTMAYTYRVCTVYDHVYSMLFVQWNSIPSNKMLTEYRLHKSCGC